MLASLCLWHHLLARIYFLLVFFRVATVTGNEFEESGEFVQEDEDELHSKEITSKIIVTLTPFLALFCLVIRFFRYISVAYHMIYRPSNLAMKPQTPPLLANIVWLS